MATAGLPPAGRHERGRFGSAGLCAGIVERGRGLLGALPTTWSTRPIVSMLTGCTAESRRRDSA